QTNDRQARAGRKQLRLGCLVRAATSWFRVGNPSAIGWHQRRIFRHPCYPWALPDNEQKNRDAQFAPKNGQKPKPIGLVAPQEGAETMPRGGGGSFCFFWLAGAWWPPRGEPNETRRVVPLADSWRPRGDRPIHHVAFGRACLASN